MIALLVVGTLLGVLESAIGFRRLRARLPVAADGPNVPGRGLAAPAMMVLGGVGAVAVGLSLLPFAAAAATPGWVSAAAGGAQTMIVVFTAGGAWIASRG